MNLIFPNISRAEVGDIKRTLPFDLRFWALIHFVLFCSQLNVCYLACSTFNSRIYNTRPYTKRQEEQINILQRVLYTTISGILHCLNTL